jgi:putative glycerol-1-phosphate prenyltransferase
MNKFQQQFNEAVLLKQKKFAILIDPDKATEQHLDKIIRLSNESVIDYFFVGGSILVNGALEKTIDYLKSKTKIPVIIFPGAQTQVYNKADAILLLSLISGRNPELLIGNHVQAAAN